MSFESYPPIKLTEEQYKRFIEVLENPPPPTQALKDLMKNYREMVASGKIIVKDKF